ncbi:MAG: hypothetical protein V3T31_12080 [candidate division Zixibacteria bacterium]
MSTNMYIPVGRTSLVKRGDMALQLQTEYAPRPAPRITTTISSNGQVMHKVERPLDRPIETFEQQRHTERLMRRQHDEISVIIQQESFAAVLNLPPMSAEVGQGKTITDRLRDIPGVTHIFRLDHEGNFVGKDSAKLFRKSFSAVSNSLRDLISLFARLPGVDGAHETGVCEIEPNRLYFASVGSEYLFIVIPPDAEELPYDALIKAALKP